MMRLGAKALISSYSARVWARVSVLPLPPVGSGGRGSPPPPVGSGGKGSPPPGVDVGVGVAVGLGVVGGSVEGAGPPSPTGSVVPESPGGGPGGTDSCAAEAAGQATASSRVKRQKASM